jgi:hypothetical protein
VELEEMLAFSVVRTRKKSATDEGGKGTLCPSHAIVRLAIVAAETPISLSRPRVRGVAR